MMNNISDNILKEISNASATTYTYGSYARIGYVYATHEDYVELMPTWGYAVSAFVLFIIGFFGFFLNLMVIILMFKDKQLWTPLNLILFNLVCSDFSVSILGNPFTLISALSHRWVFGKTMCVMYGFFMTLLAVKQHIAALKNLSQPVEDWGALLVCILTRKLDVQTSRAYHLERDNKSLPSTEKLLQFMESRAAVLENAEKRETTPQPSTSTSRPGGTSGITSITTLTVLSFERYMMVSRPLVSRHLSMRGASFSVFFIWCYSLAVTSPPLFGWGNFVNEAANISCSINWEEQTFNTLTYILFLFAMGLILPVSIITFSYLNIIKTMKKNSMRMGRVSKAESRVTVMVLIMIITFLVAWTPYSIFALIEQFAPYDVVSPGLAVVPALVAKSSICYDPIIYVGMNSQFRASVKKIFGFGNKEDSVQERAMENTLMSPTKPISQANDNNIRLQYLNPKNNSLVAVTIYQEDDDETNSGDETNCYDRRIKKNKLEMNKKITLTNSGNDDSTEASTEYCNKDQIENNYGQQNNLSKHNNKSIMNSQKDGKNHKRKYVTYNLNEGKDYKGGIIKMSEESKNKYRDHYDKISDHSSSGNNNETYDSNDMLLTSKDNRKNKSDYAVDNRCLIGWNEENIQSHSGNDNLCLLESPAFHFDDDP